MTGAATHPYLAHWGLEEPPFLLAPDPRFAFERGDHREGLARLLFGLTQLEGLVVITGEVGCGKTTLVQALERALRGDGFRVVSVANPARTAAGVLRGLVEAAGAGTPRGPASRLATLLRERVREDGAQGRRTVLVVDEAQRLDTRALDEVRLLTNPGDGPAAPVVLLGQPELSPQVQSLPQLAQRVVVRYHLGPMGVDETAAYLAHRVRAAGAQRTVFSERAARVVHAESGGVPRLVNLIAANALFVGFARGEAVISADTVLDVAEDRRDAASPDGDGAA
ncbi:MAG: AAA family ATPase [Actinomycetota bacterium]